MVLTLPTSTTSSAYTPRPKPVRGQTTKISIKVYTSATHLLDEIESILARFPRETNTILSHARRIRDQESHKIVNSSQSHWAHARQLCSSIERAQYNARTSSSNRQIWLTVSSDRPAGSTLDLVLACTSRPVLGNYPIFLWSPHQTSSLTRASLQPRLSLLIDELLKYVPPERVFSVFASSIITKTFAECFTQATGVPSISNPYYTALLTYVTRESLAPARTLPQPPILRLANTSDIPRVADHCFEFAADGDFPIDREGAELEARTYIERGQMYVAEVEGASGRDIVTICAVTRNAERHAMITKVHSDPLCRGCGYAEALVRDVCHRLLYEYAQRVERNPSDTAPYDSVALYVAPSNKAATIVYHRCGFVGLLGHDRPHGVEDVLELGFENATKGYW